MKRSQLRCDGLSRRHFVQVGAAGALGLSLRSASRAASPSPDASAKSCILIWLDGGPSHLETFDLKPQAPREVRGPFQPIATSVAGTAISELLPGTARCMDQVALIRSVTSPLGEHNFGTHYMMTGYKPTPVLEYPTMGSVVAHLRRGGGVLPEHIAVPRFAVGGSRISGHGFLPRDVAPFSVGGDPAKPDFRVRDLEFYARLNRERMDRRRTFLQALDQFQASAEEEAGRADPQFEQAYRLITSADAKQAFDLSQESPETRRRYGSKTVGQSCLLARRLIERGVPYVTVNYPGWDTHQDLVTRLKDGYTGAQKPVGLIPSLDIAFSALIEDLRERSILDQTLIVVMGEFGRTPKLNTSGGRDHWPRVFSVAIAGGGVKGGAVIGSSDAVGEGPKDRPVTPSDLAATLYTLLGIDPSRDLSTADGRPIKVSRDGEVIRELIA